VTSSQSTFAKRSLRSADLLSPFHTPARRQSEPQQPANGSVPLVPSSRKCYDSLDACTNATDSCSGRGACRPATQVGRPCFVCACARINGTQFAGDTCTTQDISGDFFLTGGTVVLLVVVVVASVWLLSQSGGEDLPQVLELSAGNAKHQ
jgi:hypothetical protein